MRVFYFRYSHMTEEAFVLYVLFGQGYIVGIWTWDMDKLNKVAIRNIVIFHVGISTSWSVLCQRYKQFWGRTVVPRPTNLTLWRTCRYSHTYHKRVSSYPEARRAYVPAFAGPRSYPCKPQHGGYDMADAMYPDIGRWRERPEGLICQEESQVLRNDFRYGQWWKWRWNRLWVSR
jgi:hypothetical protein